VIGFLLRRPKIEEQEEEEEKEEEEEEELYYIFFTKPVIFEKYPKISEAKMHALHTLDDRRAERE